jgi:hypothetical protein
MMIIIVLVKIHFHWFEVLKMELRNNLVCVKLKKPDAETFEMLKSAYQVELKLKGTHQLLAYADYVNLL